jgi:hypothetical protein
MTSQELGLQACITMPSYGEAMIRILVQAQLREKLLRSHLSQQAEYGGIHL